MSLMLSGSMLRASFHNAARSECSSSPVIGSWSVKIRQTKWPENTRRLPVSTMPIVNRNDDIPSSSCT
ncbi:hypothetical protein ACFSHP_15265 [Novosphingobium panipatense]